MRYGLRALLILMAVGPPLLAWGWCSYREYRLRQETRLIMKTRMMMFITPRLTILEEEDFMLGIEIAEK